MLALSLYAAILPLLPTAALGWAGAVFLLALRPTLTMLLRLKWLFLAMFVAYGINTPGDPVFPSFPNHSPTVQGLVLALRHAWRLALLVAGWQVLLGSLGTTRLLAGLYRLTGPFRRLGLDAGRFAVRLALTLDYAERLGERPARELLADIHLLEEDRETDIRIPFEALSLTDLAGILITGAILLSLLQL